MDVKGEKNLEKLYARFDNVAKLIRKGDISDELGYALEGEILKLKALFRSVTEPTDEVTLPTETKQEDFDVYAYLLNNLK
jgi:hypothetical protein